MEARERADAALRYEHYVTTVGRLRSQRVRTAPRCAAPCRIARPVLDCLDVEGSAAEARSERARRPRDLGRELVMCEGYVNADAQSRLERLYQAQLAREKLAYEQRLTDLRDSHDQELASLDARIDAFVSRVVLKAGWRDDGGGCHKPPPASAPVLLSPSPSRTLLEASDRPARAAVVDQDGAAVCSHGAAAVEEETAATHSGNTAAASPAQPVQGVAMDTSVSQRTSHIAVSTTTQDPPSNGGTCEAVPQGPKLLVHTILATNQAVEITQAALCSTQCRDRTALTAVDQEEHIAMPVAPCSSSISATFCAHNLADQVMAVPKMEVQPCRIVEPSDSCQHAAMSPPQPLGTAIHEAEHHSTPDKSLEEDEETDGTTFYAFRQPRLQRSNCEGISMSLPDQH